MADIEEAQATATAAAAAAKAKYEEAYAKANELGFFSHFSEYNQELINPAQKLMEDEGLSAAATLKEKGLYMFEKAKAEVIIPQSHAKEITAFALLRCPLSHLPLFCLSLCQGHGPHHL